MSNGQVRCGFPVFTVRSKEWYIFWRSRRNVFFECFIQGRLYQRNIQGGEDYTVTNPANAAGRFLKEVIISKNKS